MVRLSEEIESKAKDRSFSRDQIPSAVSDFFKRVLRQAMEIVGLTHFKQLSKSLYEADDLPDQQLDF